MSAMMKVTCACGTVGERHVAEGALGEALNRLGWVCPACTVRLEADEAVKADRERYSSREKFSSVPRGLRRSIEELQLTPRNADAVGRARAWVAGEIPGLLLTGPVGTGKTTIAAAAVWERQLHAPTRWACVPTMLANALRAFDDEERVGAVDAISGKGSLALDDLDKGKSSEWAVTQLFSAIDSRIVGGRSLMVTMNMDLDALAQKFGEDYGEPIVSRLVGYCEIVVIDGADRRLLAS